MELDNFLKVLVFADETKIKGLQWALDRSSFLAKRFRLFQAPLDGGLADPSQHDLTLTFVDLGASFSSEVLRVYRDLPGLVCFIQPTPQQLLGLGEYLAIKSTAWDGTSYDSVLESLDQVAQGFDEKIKLRTFADSCRAWIRQSQKQAGTVHIFNIPSEWTGRTMYNLDPKRGLINVGPDTDGFDIRLPIATDRELGAFHFQEGQWHFSSRAPEVRAPEGPLGAGDRIEIGEIVLQIRMIPKIEEFRALAKRYQILEDSDVPGKMANENPRSVIDLCQELLYAGSAGELQINSGLRNGTVYFSEGQIVYVLAGAVSGEKALLRMFSWDQSQWKFHPDRMPGRSDYRRMGLGAAQFSYLAKTWSKAWGRLSHVAPPLNLKVRVNPTAFYRRPSWTTKETKVLSSICEFRLVRDVLNNCPLLDFEIIESLVMMRKEGLIEPIK